jgi:hypothetical protein
MRYLLLILSVLTCLSLSARDNYKVEKIPPPPSKHGTKQIDGMCFTPDGRLAVCLPSGEIWLMNTSTKKWTLFAEGLHNPLGIFAIDNSNFVVCQRPELTKVSDTDGDGKADFYECMSDEFGVSGNYHEFNFTCVRDKEGNIYFGLGTGSAGNGIRQIVRGKYNTNGRPGRMHASIPYRGWIMKYTKDGKTIPWSSGHRTPNGLGFDLKGNLFVSDNQGDWIGTSKLFHVKKDNFYGHAASFNWRPGVKEKALNLGAEGLNKFRTRAAILFPHGSMANSPTQPIVDDRKGAFGPFHGQMYIGEMNQPRVIRLMMEEVDGVMQGACVPFVEKGKLPRGSNRLAFAPDNSLYVGHTKHTWAGSEGITRIVWDGKTPMDVLKMNITEKGFKLTFTKPINKEIAGNKNTYKFSRYWYEYHVGYGSKTFEKSTVKVKSVKVAKDGLSVDIELDELKCYFIHELRINKLTGQDGSKLENGFLAYTVNKLLKNTPPEPVQYQKNKSKKKKKKK